MRTMLIAVVVFFTKFGYSQTSELYPKSSFKVDTLYFLCDSSNLFVRHYLDSNLVKSYYCSVDSSDQTYRYGFLHSKKGRYRDYYFKNYRDLRYYLQTGKYAIRDVDYFPSFIRLLK